MAQDVVALYEEHLGKRGFVDDPAQRRAVERLQRLFEEWSAYKKKRSNALTRLLVHPDLPKGVYLWGPVGRGKSFLMDAFFRCVPLVRKRRVHFHHFMREIHRDLDELRGTEDPIAAVAERTARRAHQEPADGVLVAIDDPQIHSGMRPSDRAQRRRFSTSSMPSGCCAGTTSWHSCARSTQMTPICSA